MNINSDMQNLIFLILFFSTIFWILLSIVYWSWRNGISPMPTMSKAKKTLFAALPEHLNGQIYELGSGWGSLAFPLAKKFPQCQICGLESSPIPYYFSKIRLWIQPRKNLELKKMDFFSVDLRDASLVICYLYPGAMRNLKMKFEEELRPGTFIVSNTFGIPGWDPLTIHEISDLYHTKIYVYQMKSEY
jgi:hypothetical protein